MSTPNLDFRNAERGVRQICNPPRLLSLVDVQNVNSLLPGIRLQFLRGLIDAFIVQSDHRWMLHIIHDGPASISIKQTIDLYEKEDQKAKKDY